MTGDRIGFKSYIHKEQSTSFARVNFVFKNQYYMHNSKVMLAITLPHYTKRIILINQVYY